MTKNVKINLKLYPIIFIETIILFKIILIFYIFFILLMFLIFNLIVFLAKSKLFSIYLFAFHIFVVAIL